MLDFVKENQRREKVHWGFGCGRLRPQNLPSEIDANSNCTTTPGIVKHPRHDVVVQFGIVGGVLIMPDGGVPI